MAPAECLPFPPRLCRLPAVQHNTSGGVARYPARSVFEYTLFYLRCFSPWRLADLSIPPVAPAERLPFPPRLCHLPAVQHNTSGGVARYPLARYLSIRFFCIFCINILAYIEKNPYLCSHFIGRLFGTTFRGFLVGVLFNLGDEA